MQSVLFVLANILLTFALALLFRSETDFWKRVFSDEGEPSLSRVATGVAVLFACVWISIIVAHNFALPDFAGVCFFIGTLYGLNVGIKALKDIKTAPNTTPNSGDK
jgi:hypothetical protein